MNRHITFALTTGSLLFAGLALPPGDAIAQQKTLKEQLVGSWTLVSTDTTAPDGTKRRDFGANPKGILILDAGGWYALVQSRPDRPKFKPSSNVRSDTSAAEFGEAAKGFAANFGTWSVNEADKTLVRKYEGALIPNNEGIETKTSVSLAGDELKLVGETLGSGAKVGAVYKRTK
jgi:hypothetical protein